MATATLSAPQGRNSHDLRTIATIWVVLSIVGDLAFWFLAGPHIPPGRMSDQARGAQFDFNVLFVIALPVVILVWTYLGFAVIRWRASRPNADEAPVIVPPRTALRIQTSWIAITSVVVIGLFGFGTYELIAPAGAGGGEGPTPIWKPNTKTILPIQVIGQQWMWTYRYPSFGGFETTQLMVPNNTEIAFHVTSLDVVHDFWAYQLGVKADANPNEDDVAYVKPEQLGRFTVRCDELCGLWHGAMYGYGHVVAPTAFYHWATTTEKKLAANTKTLPPFAWTYTPGANGANGSFYPSNVDPYSKSSLYGSSTVKVKQYGASAAQS